MINKEKKYVIGYKTGIKLFIILIILAIIIFGIFCFIQDKKDRDFELSRPKIPNVESSIDNLEDNK